MSKNTLAQKREAGLVALVEEHSAIEAMRKKAEARHQKALKPVTDRTVELRKRIGKFAGKHGFSPHEVDQMISHRVALATRPAPEKAAKPDPEPDAKEQKTAMAGTGKPARG